MGLFSKDYTSADFDKLREKRNYKKLIKLLKYKERRVAKMAEETLHELMGTEGETENRIRLFDTAPMVFDGLVKKMEAAQQKSPDLDIEPIIRVFVEESEPLRRRKQAEQDEVDRLFELLTELGVKGHHEANVRSLKRLMEPDEVIESAWDEGQKGTTIIRYYHSLHTNKALYLLQGLANHADWGTVEKIAWDCFHAIKEKGLLIKKYEVSGKAIDDFSFVVVSEDPLLKQLGKYGTPQFKDALRQLGLLETDSQAGLVEEETT